MMRPLRLFMPHGRILKRSDRQSPRVDGIVGMAPTIHKRINRPRPCSPFGRRSRFFTPRDHRIGGLDKDAISATTVRRLYAEHGMDRVSGRGPSSLCGQPPGLRLQAPSLRPVDIQLFKI
jgi:hypothetical protein